MRKIILSKGKFALIDDEDFDKVMEGKKWYCSKRGYAIRNTPMKGGKCETEFLHRFILKPEKGFIIDHINHNILDNRKINLRQCNKYQNQWNRKSSKKFKGVFRQLSCKYERWFARIKVNKITYHLGMFEDPKKAALAYNKKAKELHGNFAFLNKI